MGGEFFVNVGWWGDWIVQLHYGEDSWVYDYLDDIRDVASGG